jgi:Domain of unknown function (DUF5925)/ATPase family associated with various cellular activities (AAA)
VAEDDMRVGLNEDVDLESSPASLFVKRTLERRLGTVRSEDWSTSCASLEPAGPPELHVSGHQREQALLEHDGAVLHLGLFSGHLYAAAAAAERETVDRAFAWLREQFPAPDPSSTHEVNVTFWTYGPHGPQPTWRSISVPGWEEIRDNYPAVTRAKLEPLMSGFQPARGGQLLLWHGRAGTGKTFGLRALAWEWRDWCEFHYIVDPDSFFGQHADYLMNVLLQPTYHDIEEGGMFGPAGPSGYIFPMRDRVENGDGEESVSKGWKLLMLEDTGELLTADARAVIGQGLSRFLNVVDGLIGQGLRVLVLVTTNEEIRKLHPAVARPGRCAANVDFLPLSAEEAQAWLERHGVERPADGAATLASLYALAEGLDPAEERITGFAG